jgi:hypothetical protein
MSWPSNWKQKNKTNVLFFREAIHFSSKTKTCASKEARVGCFQVFVQPITLMLVTSLHWPTCSSATR